VVADGRTEGENCSAQRNLDRPLLAVKSGAGLAILPVPLGDAQEDLVRVIDPAPKLLSPINLLVHPDLRNVPRLRTFLDFVLDGMETYRPMLLGEVPLRI